MNDEIKKIMWQVLFSDINKKTVVRETEKTVTFINTNGRNSRANKVSNYERWFNTFEDAKDFLIKKSETKISIAKATISKESDRIKELFLMEEK